MITQPATPHHAVVGCVMSGSITQNYTALKPFKWTKRSISAALLVAEDDLTDEQIAAHEDVGVVRKTLANWKTHPEFQAKVDEHIVAFQERARKEGLGRLDKRKKAAEDRHRRMSALLEARARLLAEEIEGGDTGTQVRSLKSVTVRHEPDPNDPDSKTVRVREEVWEYQFDAALMRELRELEKQIAQDTGDWMEKREVSGPGGGAIPITTVEIAGDEGDT